MVLYYGLTQQVAELDGLLLKLRGSCGTGHGGSGRGGAHASVGGGEREWA